MPETYHDPHGKSVANWSGVSLLILAAALIAAGVAWGVHALQIAGVIVAIIGVATGLILSKLGFGAPRIPPPPAPGTQGTGTESPAGR